MWIACYTQEEIAEAVGCDRHNVDNYLRKTEILPDNAKPAANHNDGVDEIVCSKTEELPESKKSCANHLTDFEPPIYNIWKQQEMWGVMHFGIVAILHNPTDGLNSIRVRTEHGPGLRLE